VKFSKLLATAIAFLSVTFAGESGYADVIVPFDLVGVTFDDGGTATGSFSIDIQTAWLLMSILQQRQEAF
jgi:hypothetical protein